MRSWIENELIELINSDQSRLSIPIQFQFRIFQFNSNSIHAELNWIDYQFQFNSWIDPSPGLSRFYHYYFHYCHCQHAITTIIITIVVVVIIIIIIIVVVIIIIVIIIIIIIIILVII